MKSFCPIISLNWLSLSLSFALNRLMTVPFRCAISSSAGMPFICSRVACCGIECSQRPRPLEWAWWPCRGRDRRGFNLRMVEGGSAEGHGMELNHLNGGVLHYWNFCRHTRNPIIGASPLSSSSSSSSPWSSSEWKWDYCRRMTIDGKNIILISVLFHALCGKIDFHFGFYLNRVHRRGSARGGFSSIVVHSTSAEQCQNKRTHVTCELVEENSFLFYFGLINYWR